MVGRRMRSLIEFRPAPLRKRLTPLSFPEKRRKTFTSADMARSLRENGLTPSAVRLVFPSFGVVGAYCFGEGVDGESMISGKVSRGVG